MKKLDLVFFKYSEVAGSHIESDGALFVDFQQPEKHQYLVFLRKDEGVIQLHL